MRGGQRIRDVVTHIRWPEGLNGGRPAYSGRRIAYATGPEGECKAASALGRRSPLAMAQRMNAGRLVFTGRADEGVLA